MAAAGFSIGEAEGLRRAMSRKRSEEAIEAWRPRFVAGALERGMSEEIAHVIYDKLVGFAGFGFPKSHAAAFALLAYQSAWLRRYYPGEFLCALLNAQPMGFYPPSSLVRDAQRRGVEVRSPHINRSRAECTIEDGRSAGRARLRGVGRRGRCEGGRGGTAVCRPRRPRSTDGGACSTRSRRSSLRARATTGGRAASCSGGSASLRAARRSRAATASWRCRSSRRPRSPSCRSRRTGSRCSPTTSTRRCRSASTRCSCCGRICRPAWRRAPSCRRRRTGR